METAWSIAIFSIQIGAIIFLIILMCVGLVHGVKSFFTLLEIRTEYAQKKLRTKLHDRHQEFVAEMERKQSQKALPGVIDVEIEKEDLGKWKRPGRVKITS